MTAIRTFLLSVLLLLATAATAAELDRIVAVVNDDVITLLELRARVQLVTAQLKQQGTPTPPQAQLDRQVLERMILERLQLQTAREAGIRIEDGDVDRAIARIAENNRMSQADLRKAVAAEGLNWDSFRDDIRNEMTLGRLREREVDSRITIGAGEIEAYLANAEARSTREYQIAHILLRAPEGARPAQWNQLQARADEVMRLLRQGEDFRKLAAAFSDAQDAMQGGALDWRPADRLPPLFADAIAGLRPGQNSPVLRSPAGLHIVKLVAQRDVSADKVEKVEQTRARHILLRNADGLSDADAQRRLTALRERIVGGADFAELARANSSDITSAKGGDLGWLSPGDTVPEFERAMDALKPGEISQPVQSPFGWHLIQVQERRTADVTDERRRAEARAALRARKSDEVYEDWLRSLRDRAYVELRLEQP